ncbi:uncharacterized protein LOC133799878 [Humulus lupulus]|uniref:uncharacterized protein LOC133799878 n=1 Tax=Humulus lupulus TaxID=3486 RepID=UPI002B40C919|nr:uncharacterized protein LOC133799878 [Humulus lupulus]
MQTKQNHGANITRVQTFQKAHTRKNGEPINSTTSEFLGQLDDIIRENPNSETIKNIEDDALTILFGEPKSGRQIGQGRGMSKSKLTVVHMYQDKIEVLEKEQHNMKKQLAELLKLFKENGGKVSTSDGPSHINHSRKGEMVAEGRWSSSDPKTHVHGIPLGPEFMRVWVDIAISPSAYLFCPSHSMITIQEVVGSIIAWPSEKKREAPAGEKPEPVRTHLRNMIIVPEMIGSIISVYNGKTFNQVEIKPEMIGHYLAEFSISYKPVNHGRPGIGATHSSRFIPLK